MYHPFFINEPPCALKSLATAVTPTILLQVSPDCQPDANDDIQQECPVISQECVMEEEEEDCDCSVVYSPPRKKIRVGIDHNQYYHGHDGPKFPTDATAFDSTEGSYHLLRDDVPMSESDRNRWWLRKKHTQIHCKHKRNDCNVMMTENTTSSSSCSSSKSGQLSHHHLDALTCHVCCQQISRPSSIHSSQSRLTFQGPSSTTIRASHLLSQGGTTYNTLSSSILNQEQPKQQVSLLSYFHHPTKKQQQHQEEEKEEQSRSFVHPFSLEAVGRRQDPVKLNTSSCMSCCAYCDRPACHSCMRACEGGCNEYYCTFCSTIDYQGVQEKLLCFACRDENGGGGGDEYTNFAGGRGGDHDMQQ